MLRSKGYAIALLSGVLLFVAACTQATTAPADPLMGSLSDEAQAALAPGADMLVPARHIMEAHNAGVDIVFVDARTQNDFDYGHIPGAVNVPYFDPVPHLGELPRDKLIVSYCECPHAEAVQTAEALLANGFTNVKVIDEGLAGWVEQGGTTVPTE